MIASQALEAFENFYNSVMPAQENSLESFVWLTGTSNPLFNAIMHLRTRENLNEKIEAIISQSPDQPVSFWAHDLNESPKLTEILEEKGFTSPLSCSLMT